MKHRFSFPMFEFGGPPMCKILEYFQMYNMFGYMGYGTWIQLRVWIHSKRHPNRLYHNNSKNYYGSNNISWMRYYTSHLSYTVSQLPMFLEVTIHNQILILTLTFSTNLDVQNTLCLQSCIVKVEVHLAPFERAIISRIIKERCSSFSQLFF